MATERNRLVFEHITRVWLADPDSNDIDHLLRGENRTNLRLLKPLVRRPGLELRATTFINEDGDESTLSEDHIEELKAVESFETYLQNWFGPPGLVGTVDITTASREDFLSFINQHQDLENNPVQEDNDLMIRAHTLRTGHQGNNNHPPGSIGSQRSGPQRSRSITPPRRPTTNWLLAHYNKEKRPLSDYTFLLKSVKEFAEFDRHLRAIAHTHGVENVLNASYSPSPGSDEYEVFGKMKTHMYSVFVKLVKETKGLCIVKSHKDDMDAQAIYGELLDYYTGTASQMAICNLNEMEDSIIEAKIPKNRHQDMSVMMHKWKALVEDFNSTAPIDRYINDSTQLVYLKRFIKDVPELHDINKLVDVMCNGIQNNGRVATPAEKIQIYFNIATRYDSETRGDNRGRGGNSTRNIHTAEILGGGDTADAPLETNNHEVPPYEEDQIDWEAVERLEAHATFFRGLKMNKVTWDSLSPEAKRTWDELPQKDKNIILRSRAGMSSSNPGSTPPSSAQPAQPPSALRSPPNQQRVEFHEIPDRVPSIADQYETNYSEVGTPRYDVNRATQNVRDATVALSNDTFYTPSQSEESNIFNIITSTPKDATPHDASSAAYGERYGNSDIPNEDRKQRNPMSNLIRQLSPKRYTRMAITIKSSTPKIIPRDDHTWGDHATREYARILVDTTSQYPQLRPNDITATHIRHLLLQYVTWQSKSMRKERYRIAAGSGESNPKMDILGWDSIRQGTVPTGTIGTEAYSHQARVSIAATDVTETVDQWENMREMRGSRTANGEEDDVAEWSSTVDGGNNRGLSGLGMRFMAYASPKHCVDLFGIQGKAASNMSIGTFVSIITLNTGEEVLGVFAEYAHNPKSQRAIHSTLQLTDHGMIVEDRSPRFGTTPSISTPQGDVIPLSFTDGLPLLQLRYPTDMEVFSTRRIHLTGSETWDPSRYDRPSTIHPIVPCEPATQLPPMDPVDIHRAYLPNDDGTSNDTSRTGNCDSLDSPADNDTTNDISETIVQVSFRYNEVIRELKELSAYKEIVRHRSKAVLKQLQEVSIRGDIEGELISSSFGDDYPRGEYVTVPPRQAPSRDDDGNIIRLPSGGNTTYTGSWTTFQIRNESAITEARFDEVAHRHNVHQVYTGRSGNTKAKLNQRIRQLAFQHNMVKHLTMIIKSPWHGYSHDDTHTSVHTLVLHPSLLEFMRIHGFGSRTIAEGIMFGDADRFSDMKIDMFGRMSNMHYEGPSFECPDDVLKEFKIGRT